MIDLDRIIQTGIPDIASVYGGVRGRTMSSRHQSHAWLALVESGIKVIIDLREADKSEKLPTLCQHHGVNYFHYPIVPHAPDDRQYDRTFPPSFVN